MAVTLRQALIGALALGMASLPIGPANAFLPLSRPQPDEYVDPSGSRQTASVDPSYLHAGIPALGLPDPEAQHHDALAIDILIHVSERPLADLLGDLARIAGLRLRLNDRFDREIVNRRRLAGTLEEILDTLGAEFNLVWFAERGLVDIARADTATVKTFQIGRTSDRQIRDAIARFGLINADFALEVDESNGLARVFAPPRLSARIESIIVGLRPPAETDMPVEVIRFGQRGRPGE
jgi:hypothetical protein